MYTPEISAFYLYQLSIPVKTLYYAQLKWFVYLVYVHPVFKPVT